LWRYISIPERCYRSKMTIDVRHLRCALAALEQGSLRKAATALGLRQVTVARHIEAIETRIGYSLFVRQRNGVHPTTDGMDFLHVARRLLRDMDRLIADPETVRRNRVERLTIGFYTSVSAGNLRATLTEFRTRCPDLQLRLVGGSRRDLLKGVECGDIDVAIVTASGLLWPDASLPLWPERCVILLPNSHPLAAETVLEWAMLRKERFLTSTVDPGPEISEIIRFHLHRGSYRPVIVEHETSLHILRPLVAEGRGLLLDCESSTGECGTGLTYREIRHENMPSEIRFAACWSQNNPNRSLGTFLTLLRERYPDLSGRTDPTSPPGGGAS
jgi:DNA-binding transcriptional LysR family regulator